MFKWLFTGRRQCNEMVSSLLAENERLRAELAAVRESEKPLRLLVNVLRDCNRTLDERLNAMEGTD